jgi:hypothetical protein
MKGGAKRFINFSSLQTLVHLKLFRFIRVGVLNLKELVELKKKSRDPKDKQRLTVLEETLRQVNGEYGADLKPKTSSAKNDDVGQ